MAKEIMITTEDNPFDPFSQWDEWYFYDLSQGYNSCERLARLVKTSPQLSDAVNNVEVEDAIDTMMYTGAIGKNGKFVQYKKIEREEQKIIYKPYK